MLGLAGGRGICVLPNIEREDDMAESGDGPPCIRHLPFGEQSERWSWRKHVGDMQYRVGFFGSKPPFCKVQRQANLGRSRSVQRGAGGMAQQRIPVANVQFGRRSVCTPNYV